MAMKEIGHDMDVVVPVRSVSCANAAAFNTAFTTTSIDTRGCESVMFILSSADDNSTPDYVFRLMESNTSVTDAGTNVAAADMIVHGRIAATGLVSDGEIAAGVLTTTADASEDVVYIFEYIGDMRWVRLQSTVGTKTNHFTCTVIKSHFRRGPVVV